MSTVLIPIILIRGERWFRDDRNALRGIERRKYTVNVYRIEKANVKRRENRKGAEQGNRDQNRYGVIETLAFFLLF